MDNDGLQLIPPSPTSSKADGDQPPAFPSSAQDGIGQPIVLYAVPPLPSHGPSVISNYNGRFAIVLGAFLIVCGGLEMIFNIALMATVAFHIQYIGHGIWVGCSYVLTGALTIVAGRWKTTCMIVSSLVLSILSCVLTCFLIGFCGGALGEAARNMRWRYGTYNYTTGEYVYNTAEAQKALSTSHGLDSMMILCGVLCFVACVWISALTCIGFQCCGPPLKPQHHERVQYRPQQNQQQPVVLLLQGEPKQLPQGGTGIPVTMVPGEGNNIG